MTDRELMQQALEALELLAWYENPATKVQVRKPRNGGPIVTMYPHKVATEAAAPLRERLAQPEQSPLDRMAENARELGLDYEPVQKEKPDGRQTTGPLTDRTDHVRNGDDYMPEPVGEIVQAFADLTAVSIPVMPPVGTKLYTTPPRREWVGLTEEDFSAINQSCLTKLQAATSAEAILKEKNS